MFNPLVNNLSHLNTAELEEKVVELQRKYFQTGNPSVQAQLANFLDIYKDEIKTRRAIEAQRQKEQQDGENDLDNLINIS
jgi:hypothetical protein